MPNEKQEVIRRIHNNLESLTLSQLKSIEKHIEQSKDRPHIPLGSVSLKADWPHAPIHRLGNNKGTFFVTGGTLGKQQFFDTRNKLDLVHNLLLNLAKQYSWQLEAWAVFSNHYHFVGTSENPKTLTRLLTHLHATTARQINDRENKQGRQVWFNFWETELTFEQSYLARLNYVHQNAVHHQLVPVANQYPWCSAQWFEQAATPAQIKTIYGFKTDRINVNDDFETVTAIG